MLLAAAVALIALIGAALIGFGMWLEWKKEQRRLEILEKALEDGHLPPDVVIEHLIAAPAGGESVRVASTALRRTAFLFMALAVIFFLISVLAHDGGPALLHIASAAALAGAALFLLYHVGRSRGL